MCVYRQIHRQQSRSNAKHKAVDRDLGLYQRMIEINGKLAQESDGQRLLDLGYQRTLLKEALANGEAWELSTRYHR